MRTAVANSTKRRCSSQQALQKQFPEYVAKLQKDAGVEILDEKLKAQQLPQPADVPAGHPPVKPGAK